VVSGGGRGGLMAAVIEGWGDSRCVAALHDGARLEPSAAVGDNHHREYART
jgi:hypothetical protein